MQDKLLGILRYVFCDYWKRRAVEGGVGGKEKAASLWVGLAAYREFYPLQLCFQGTVVLFLTSFLSLCRDFRSEKTAKRNFVGYRLLFLLR